MNKRLLGIIMTIIITALPFISCAEGTDDESSAEISGMKNIKVASMCNQSAALKENGTVWTWGSSEVESETSGDGSVPVQVAELTDVIDIAVGSSHMAAVKSDGTVWTWGDNSVGQLGDGTNVGSSVPVQVSGLTDIKTVAAGYEHTVAVKNDGTVYAWGLNSDGQLGDGSTENSNVPTEISGLSNINSVSCGYNFTAAVNTVGAVYVWGDNSVGQLGDGTTTDSHEPILLNGLSGIISVAAGNGHMVALTENKTVYTWGTNTYGQLGNGTTTLSNTPAEIVDLSGIASVAAGSDHTVAVSESGSVYTWGRNNLGQLGNGGIIDSSAPAILNSLSGVTSAAAGSTHTVVLTTEGIIYTCGNNAYGQLGNEYKEFRKTPILVDELSDVTAIAVGNLSTVALKSDGTVWTWGNNTAGQLGYDLPEGLRVKASSEAAQVSGLSDIKAIASGCSHTVALGTDGTVYTWGDNRLGQLGDDTTTSRQTLSAVSSLSGIKAIAAGGSTTFALAENGTVYAWGDNTYGQLGNGTTENSSVPLEISGLSGVTDISTDGLNVLALKSDGTVYAWGLNSLGSLGNGTWDSSSVPAAVENLTNIKEVSAGFAHSAAVDENGDVYVWGWNLDGEYAISSTNNDTPVKLEGFSDVKALSSGYQHNVAVKSDGIVYAWGQNQYGELGDGTIISHSAPAPVSGLNNIKAVAAQRNHTAALTEDGRVYTWGLNSYGQLGDGRTFEICTFSKIDGEVNDIYQRILSAPQIEIEDVEYKTPFEQLNLPSTVEVSLNFGGSKILSVDWDSSTYNSERAREQIIYGNIQLADGITNPQNYRAEAKVNVLPPILITSIERSQITAYKGIPLLEKQHVIGGVSSSAGAPETVTVHLDNGKDMEMSVDWHDSEYNPWLESTQQNLFQTVEGDVIIPPGSGIENPENKKAELDVTVESAAYEILAKSPESISANILRGTPLEKVKEQLEPKVVDIEAFNVETGEVVYIFSEYTLNSDYGENKNYNPDKFGIQNLQGVFDESISSSPDICDAYIDIQINAVESEISEVPSVEMDAFQMLDFSDNSNIPQQVNVITESGHIISADVEWNASGYDKTVAGDQILSGRLINLPSGVLQPEQEKTATLIVHVKPVQYKVVSVISDWEDPDNIYAGYPLEELYEQLSIKTALIQIESTTEGIEITTEYEVPFILEEENNPDYDSMLADVFEMKGTLVLPENIINPDNLYYNFYLMTDPVNIIYIEPINITVDMGTEFADIEKPTQVNVALSNGKHQMIDVDWGNGDGYIPDSDELTEDNPIQSTVMGELCNKPLYINYDGEQAEMIITVVLPKVYYLDSIMPARIPETGTQKVNLGSSLEDIYNSLESHSVAVQLHNMKNVITTQEVTFDLREEDNPHYDSMSEAEFELTAHLNLPDTIENPNNLQLILSVRPTKYKVQSVIRVSIKGIISGTPFEEIGLPEKAPVLYTDSSEGEIPAEWDGSKYVPTKIGGQIIRGTFVDPLPVYAENPNNRQPVATVTIVNPTAQILSAKPVEEFNMVMPMSLYNVPYVSDDIIPGVVERKYEAEVMWEDGSITTEIISVFEEVE